MILDAITARIFRFSKKKPYEDAMKQTGFIVGTGRCGTTILARVLNSHSRICVPHELQIICGIGNGDRLYEKYLSGDAEHYAAHDFINLIKERCPYYFEKYFDYIAHFNNLRYPQRDLKTLLRELFDHICYDNGKEVFLEQTPWYGQKLDILKGLFPEMKVIHMIRDGRDVAVSYARTPWWSNNIEANLLQWAKEIKIIHEYGQKNPVNFLEIRYEDLVQNPKQGLEMILNMFGVGYEENMADPEKLINYTYFFKGSAANHQSRAKKVWEEEKQEVFFRGSINSWKGCSDYDFACMPSVVKETLKAFGYVYE